MYLVLKITHPRSDGLNQSTTGKLFITHTQDILAKTEIIYSKNVRSKIGMNFT